MNEHCHNCGQAHQIYLYAAPAFDGNIDPMAAPLGLARCRNCGIVNTVGVKMEDLAATYTAEYYGSGTRKFLSAIESVIALTSRRQAGKILRLWRAGRSAQAQPSVLDIGCGRGNLLRAFAGMGAAVLGLEREEFPHQERSADIVRVGALEDPQYSDRRFDIIILWHVLEHLEQPAKLLDTITEHLNEDGLLVIAVPNYASLQQRLFSKHWFHLDLPRHLVHFEAPWLLEHLTNRGYKETSVSYTDALQNVYGFLQSAMNAAAPERPNEYYRLLKHGRLRAGTNALVPTLKWSLLAMVLLPFAVLESLVGSLANSGATVQIAARLETKPETKPGTGT